MDSAALLTAFERCRVAAYFARDWRRFKLDDIEFLQSSLRAGFTTERRDHGQAAGEHCYELGANPGIVSTQMDVHSQVVHLSALSDILATAIRRDGEKPWSLPSPTEIAPGVTWRSSAFLSPDGTHLRRVVLASSWSDDRHYAESRSWFSLGEVCVYGLPMQQVVAVIGQSRNGKRHSWWTHGLQHPMNRKLRFRKRNQLDTPFKETWKEVWREDDSDVSTKQWLQSMLDDDVLRDCSFKIDIPVPERMAQQEIVDLAVRKLEAVEKFSAKPAKNLSTCDWPVPCRFRTPCHGNDTPGRKYGFVPIDEVVTPSYPRP